MNFAVHLVKDAEEKEKRLKKLQTLCNRITIIAISQFMILIVDIITLIKPICNKISKGSPIWSSEMKCVDGIKYLIDM